MTNTLNVVDLDRDAQLADLRNYLRTQPQFKDYDFDGAALSVLLRLLAYNSNKGAFLTNMLFAEAFLDSAQMSSSVSSHAKDLNYLPRSIKSASANLTVSFSATGASQPYIIPKGSAFSTLVKSTSFQFSTNEAITVSSANNNFTFTTQVYEGSYFKDVYTYQTTLDAPLPRFPITSKNCDISSLTVVVLTSGGLIGETYTYRSSLLDVKSDSKVFFIQAAATGGYEVLFGDSIVGVQPPEGATVVLDYRVTSGEKANGAQVFVASFDPTGNQELSSTVVINANEIGATGAPPEPMDSVRYYAPRWFQARERAVVASDYSVLLRTKFPEITAANVYGGEDANPPQFGKVIVSVAIQGLDKIPDSKVAAFTAYLKKRNSIGIKPVFIAAEYTYLEVDTLVKYNVAVTTESPNRISSLVSDAIQTYSFDHLNDFQTQLRYSKLVEAIDSADKSIVSNETSILCYKKFYPKIAEANEIDGSFNFVLLKGIPPVSYPHPASLETVFSSSVFTYQGLQARLEDDGNGRICIVQDISGSTALVDKIGTIDYETGTFSFKNLIITNYEGSSLRLFVRPDDLDVATSQNTILTIEPAGQNIKIAQVTE
jgi:hypothetical protein